MLTQYDRSQFDVFAYSNFKGKDDRFTDLFKQSVTVWRNIAGLSDDAVAEMIRQDEIDILVDLSGHSARQPPVGFCAQACADSDHRLGLCDEYGDAGHGCVLCRSGDACRRKRNNISAEEVRYLPCAVGAFFNEQFPDVNELPALSDGIITFGSLNRLAKVSAEAYRAWAEVLLAVPRSRLILKAGELNDAAIREQVAEHFTKAGVAADRIIMQGRTSWHEHMQAYNQIDIALDPFPHGGGVTTLEGLMMGVPVINLRWPTIVGKDISVDHDNSGIDRLDCGNSGRIRQACHSKGKRLAVFGMNFDSNCGVFSLSSVIGDQVAYARAVEKEYRQLWREWCSSVED